MTTVTLEKNYKSLKHRVDALERLVKALAESEIKAEKILQWEKTSRDLSHGLGKRFNSRNEVVRYFKSL